MINVEKQPTTFFPLNFSDGLSNFIAVNSCVYISDCIITIKGYVKFMVFKGIVYSERYFVVGFREGGGLFCVNIVVS